MFHHITRGYAENASKVVALMVSIRTTKLIKAIARPEWTIEMLLGCKTVLKEN